MPKTTPDSTLHRGPALDAAAHYPAAEMVVFETLEPRLLLSAAPLSETPQIIEMDWGGQTLQVVADEWIVHFEGDDSQLTSLESRLADAGFDYATVDTLGGNGFGLIRGTGADYSVLSAWADSQVDVYYVEPDFVQVNNAVVESLTPNDPRFSQLYALNNTGQTGGSLDADIDAVEAWALTTGSSNVVIAVIDTGIDYNHSDLAANMWHNSGEIAGDGIDNDGNGYVDDIYGYDFANYDANPADGHGHGTHVAGTIGAAGNNGTGVTGINWDVQLMALKFMSDSGSGYTSRAIQAVNYATMMKRDYGVNVVATSNSWGGGSYSTSLRDAIAAGGEQGILFVAAAGNSGLNTDSNPHYPSSYDLDCVVSVAATTQYDTRASFSNYGSVTVDLGAPGQSILSTTRGGGYGSMSGTSMAAPHVAGVVGLLAAYNPDATAAEIKAACLGGADSVSSLAGKTVTGGRLNAYNSLMLIGGSDDVTGPTVLSVDPSGAVDPLSVLTVTFSENLMGSTVVAQNFALRSSGSDGLFDTADDAVVTITDGMIAHQGSAVSIDLGAALDAGAYRLTIVGTGVNPLADAIGNPLNDGLDATHLFDVVVNNVRPTATMLGVPGSSVAPGTTVVLSLGGYDNDQSGQSIVTGELQFNGQIIATTVGAYQFTAPATPGQYTLSYRVQDNEGSWSDPVSATLVVSEQVTLTVVDGQAGEPGSGLGTGTLRISRTGATDLALAVNITASSNDAVYGADYVLRKGGALLAGNTVTIDAGQSYVDVTLEAVDDSIVEATETATVSLVDGAGYTLAAGPDGIISIADDDVSTVVEVIVDQTDAGFTSTGTWKASGAVDNYGGSSLYCHDPGTTGTWTADLPQAGTYEVYVWYSAQRANGTYYNRDGRADYTVNHADGQTALELNQDVNSGQWVLMGSWNFGTTGSVTVSYDTEDRTGRTVADAVKFVKLDTPPTPAAVTLAVTDSQAGEPGSGLGTGTVRISRSGPTDAALTVNLTASSTDAVYGTDYVLSAYGVVLTGNFVTIEAGQSYVDLTLQAIDDAVVEDIEAATLTLVDGADYTLQSTTSGTITIADDDVAPPPPTPTVALAVTDSQAGEPGSGLGTGTVRISRSGPTDAALTVDLTASSTDAVYGTDYVLSVNGVVLAGNSVTIEAGQSYVDVTLQAIDDAVVESLESATLTLVDGADYDLQSAASGTITIADDDVVPPPPTPTVALAVTDSQAGEPGSGLGTGTVRISRSGPTDTALTVTLTASSTDAVYGTDYVLSANGVDLAGNSVTIEAGQSYVDVTLTAVDDAVVEGIEAATLTLVDGADYDLQSATSGTITIADDDVAPPPPPPVTEVIVDNTDPGFTTTGIWKVSGSVDGYGGGSLYCHDIGTTATWTADLDAGAYEVYVWYSAQRPDGSVYNRDGHADYTIDHAGGQTAMEINQDADYGQWRLMGSWDFGATGSITVSYDTEDPTGRTVADAVKFVKVSSATSVDQSPATASPVTAAKPGPLRIATTRPAVSPAAAGAAAGRMSSFLKLVNLSGVQDDTPTGVNGVLGFSDPVVDVLSASPAQQGLGLSAKKAA